MEKNWADRFLKRHKDLLISKWTTGIDSKRYKADSYTKYSSYFSLLESNFEKFSVEPRHIYNMDEKGFLLGIGGRSKRVFSRRMYEQGKLRAYIQDGSREWLTLLACICADGTTLPPALIYQSSVGAIQESWLEEFDAQTERAFFSASPTGWTNNELGLAWLKQVFEPSTRPKARSSYRLLILDGHGSHLSIDFLQFCRENKILVAIYPPHSTYTLQPLDVCLFKPLSAAYSNELSKYIEESQGLVSMNKVDFWPLFYAAWRASFKETTIKNAFRVTGLSPLNREVILKKFASEPEYTSDGSSSASSLSN